METTRREALDIYNLVKWINPYEVCDLDKEDHIEAIMSISLEENIEQLQDYICEGYDSPRALIEDDELLRRYLKIYNKLKKRR